MAELKRLSLNTATVNQWSLKECIEGCVRHGVPAIDPWRDKLHELGVDTAAKMISDNGLEVSALCRGGMFTGLDDASRQVALDDNRRAVDEAVAIGAQCLVLVVGGLPDGSKDIGEARGQVRDAIGTLLDYSRSCNIPLAIEPLHPMFAADRACVNTLAQANDLCDELGDGVGVAVDAYHVWWDPDLAPEIARAKGRILGFHVCDWLVPTTDLLLDRGMMGDGVIDLPAMRQMVEAAGYHGLIEVEIFSAENWWKRDGDEVMQIVIERFDKVV
ncbi:MAG: sugar phosphate isomerase/epimerase [Rhodospirillaceae bacterium]|nr:sugar phosphate isomerase/epimerase [Rhodospirillaceae bacterium]MBT7265434.1 sugar phosphate isomerase/epimerase [Rhodospirillaceae bacterium]